LQQLHNLIVERQQFAPASDQRLAVRGQLYAAALSTQD
jgi:hypothetical protein